RLGSFELSTLNATEQRPGTGSIRPENIDGLLPVTCCPAIILFLIGVDTCQPQGCGITWINLQRFMGQLSNSRAHLALITQEHCLGEFRHHDARPRIKSQGTLISHNGFVVVRHFKRITRQQEPELQTVRVLLQGSFQFADQITGTGGIRIAVMQQVLIIQPGFLCLQLLNMHPRTAAQLAIQEKCTGNDQQDRKSTRLNSSHVKISYAVFCLKKKTKTDKAKKPTGNLMRMPGKAANQSRSM